MLATEEWMKRVLPTGSRVLITENLTTISTGDWVCAPLSGEVSRHVITTTKKLTERDVHNLCNVLGIELRID